jgi:cytosine/uracil/thiamine/allantoin permease
MIGMLCYFLYWAIQFPLMFVSPQNIRHFFTVKSLIVPFAWLGILIWSFVKVPVKTSLGPLHTNLSGGTLSWAWLSALNSALGSYATLAVNIPDFTVSTEISPFSCVNFLETFTALCEK